MIDRLDASNDQLRLAVARAFLKYETPLLVELLLDKNEIVRTSAARELQSRGGDKVFEAAVAGSSHPRFETREISAFLLGQLGTPDCPYATETFTILHNLFNDAYHEVAAAAITAIGSLASLGHFAGRDIFDDVIKRTASNHVDIREASAFALGFLNDKTSGRVLTQLVEDASPAVRDMAEFSLQLRSERTDPTS